LLILDLTDFRTFAANHPDLARAVEAEAMRRGLAASLDARPAQISENRVESLARSSPSQ
jgi:hypothetical protein